MKEKVSVLQTENLKEKPGKLIQDHDSKLLCHG